MGTKIPALQDFYEDKSDDLFPSFLPCLFLLPSPCPCIFFTNTAPCSYPRRIPPQGHLRSASPSLTLREAHLHFALYFKQSLDNKGCERLGSRPPGAGEACVIFAFRAAIFVPTSRPKQSHKGLRDWSRGWGCGPADTTHCADPSSLPAACLLQDPWFPKQPSGLHPLILTQALSLPWPWPPPTTAREIFLKRNLHYKAV